MTSKTISFKTPVGAPKAAEEWVQSRAVENAPAAIPSGPTKRLTVDIPEPMHRRIKLDSVTRGIMISDVIRQLLDEKYPPEMSTITHSNGSKQ